MNDRPCRYFLTSSGCRYGKSCKYLHQKPHPTNICKFYSTSRGCKYGDQCRYKHISKSASKQTQQNKWTIKQFPSIWTCLTPLSFTFASSITMLNDYEFMVAPTPIEPGYGEYKVKNGLYKYNITKDAWNLVIQYDMTFSNKIICSDYQNQRMYVIGGNADNLTVFDVKMNLYHDNIPLQVCKYIIFMLPTLEFIQ